MESRHRRTTPHPGAHGPAEMPALRFGLPSIAQRAPNIQLMTGRNPYDLKFQYMRAPGAVWSGLIVKIVEVKRVLGKGTLAPSPEWATIRDAVLQAIALVDWPPGSGKFTINPTRHGNGVGPIQRRAAKLLDQNGWKAQYPWPIADRTQPGRMDAAYFSSHGLVAFEWETGNIASCHRSINKICLGFHIGAIAGGILALSSNRLYPFLTDRVGNIGEIERYFPLWSATPCDQGVLEIIVVEHDATSSKAPLIRRGRKDGLPGPSALNEVIVLVMTHVVALQTLDDHIAEVELNAYPPPVLFLAHRISSAAAPERIQ